MGVEVASIYDAEIIVYILVVRFTIWAELCAEIEGILKGTLRSETLVTEYFTTFIALVNSCPFGLPAIRTLRVMDRHVASKVLSSRV